MSDLISRSALLESLIKCKELGRRSFEAVSKVINEQQPVEPVRGEWIFNGFSDEWECSHCHSQIALSDDRNAHPNFCPQCGCDMRKKVEL